MGLYEILELIGAGGMDEVYRARDTKLGRDVAIKVLPEAVAQSPERLARFEREAQLLASLNHPNIATIHGLEEHEGIAYLVMELVPGETLAEKLARGPIPEKEAVELARQIIDGLEAAHESGVIHRDLKPANIKITPEGIVRILDFGLAKAFEKDGADADSSLSPTLTRDGSGTGVILGTAAYMSPEQASGRPVDKRSDIFSFGSVLFEMLSGRQAFDGENVSEILAAVIKTEPDWSRLPSAFERLVRRCLEKDPHRRLRDIGDARLELEDASTPVVAGNASSSRPVAIALALSGVVAVALSLAGVFSAPAPKDVTRFAVVLPPDTNFVDFARPGIALSPDGSQLVFRRNTNLYLRRMDRAEPELLPGTERARVPVFSPDGEWIAFFDQEGLLKKVHLGGGPPVTICSVSVTPLGADWGDDGYIVYAERERGLLRVSAAGGEPELWLDNEGMVIAYPELLGDGRVLFSSLTRDENGDAAQIILASPATSERRSLNLGGSQPRYLASGHLVFADQGQLVAVAFDANKQEVRGRVALVDGIAIASGTAAAQFAVSDSGTLVYLDYLASLSRRLVWVDRDGNTSSAQAGSRAYSDIRFSLDGRRVAVHDHGAGNDIWIYSPERGTATRMSYSPLADEVPVWSPDGRFVVYTTDNGMGRILKRAPSDGSGSEEALWETDRHTHVADWTPDGKALVLNLRAPLLGSPIVGTDYESWVWRLANVLNN